MTERTDVVVVGGGLAGLFAAVEAVEHGASVLLLDPRARLGGRARTDARRGARLNLGPHALYRRGATQAHLDRLGIVVTGAAPPPHRTRFRVGDDVRRLPTRRQAGRLGRLLAAVLAGRHDDPALGTVPLAEWIDEHHLGGAAADGLRALVRTTSYVDDVERFSTAAALAQLRLGLRDGVRYLDGGWGTIVDALATRAGASGAEVRCGAGATSVTPDGTGWLVATEQGAIAAASVVVAAGGPAQAAALLGLTDRRWEADPVEASVLDVVLDRPPRHRALFGTDQPLYLATHAPVARLVDDGRSVVSLLRYHRPGGPLPPPAATRADLEAHLAVAGGDRRRRDDARYLHRLVVAGSFPTAAAGGLRGRPGVEVEDRPGVLVAGDWVGPVGMLADAAAASGVAAGRAAAHHALTSGRPRPAAVAR